MEQALDQNQDPQPRPKRRWLRRIFLALVPALLIFTIGAGTLWYLEIPQRAALNYLARTLGVTLEVDHITVGRELFLGFVTVHDQPATEDEQPPLELYWLRLAYDAFPEDGRYLSRLDLVEPTIDLQRYADGQTNYDFLLRLRDRPKRETSSDYTAWVPQFVEVIDAAVKFASPAGSLGLKNINVEARLDSAEEFVLSLGSFQGNVDIDATRAGAVIIDEQGELTAKIQRDGDDYSIRAHADLPALAAVEAAGEFNRRGEGWYADARIDTFTLAPAAAGGVLATFLPIPLQFDRLELTDSHFKGLIALDNMQVPDAQVNLNAQALVIGTPEAPWYTGDLQLTGATSDEGRALSLNAKLGRGQALDLTVSGGLNEGEATLTFGGWSEPDLESVIPAAYREAVTSRLQFRELKANVALGWKDDQFTTNTRLDLITAGGTPAVLGIEGTGPLDPETEAPRFTGPVALSLGDQKLAGNLTLAANKTFTLDATLNAVDPNLWLQQWLDMNTLKDLATLLSGALNIATTPDSAAVPIAIDLSTPEFRYSTGAFTMAPPLTVKGTLAYNPEAKTVTADRLATNFGGDNAAVFSKLQVDLNPFAFRANTEGDTALDLIGGWFGFKDLFGQAHFSGPVRFRNNEVTAEFKIAADPLGYGDLVAPYGTPVTSEGVFTMNLDAKQGSLKPLSLAIGESTTITSPGFDLKFSPFALEGPAEIATDFYPVVAMGMLEGFTGTGSFKGPISVKDGAFQFDFATDIAAKEVILPDRLLALLDTTFTGQVRRGVEGLGGEGALSIGQAVVAGAAITNASGQARFEGDNVVLENLEGQVFGGSVRMTAILGLFAEGRPIRLQGSLSAIDLAAFTAEVKPPQVVLTGIASGNFTIAFTNGEITELQLMLQSNEGFTMNKDAVARVLMEQQLIDMTGGKQMQKIVDDVLGKSEQRPFDRATVDLSLQDKRVVGPAQLESKGLNLTIDILADWSAIMEGLKIRQKDLS
jgi:hypothetical protein